MMTKTTSTFDRIMADPKQKGAFEKEYAKQALGLDIHLPVIGSIGATREEKGLDILLSALSIVEEPFQLLIAGKEAAFDGKFIGEHSKAYQNRVHTILRFLSEEELALAFCASDIICLPYRRSFDGASGPLGEGVALGNCIIGPKHGNLAKTIRENHLGYLFESENVEDLGKVLSRALKSTFIPDDKYRSYQASLSPKSFGEKYNQLYRSVSG